MRFNYPVSICFDRRKGLALFALASREIPAAASMKPKRAKLTQTQADGNPKPLKGFQAATEIDRQIGVAGLYHQSVGLTREELKSNQPSKHWKPDPGQANVFGVSWRAGATKKPAPAAAFSDQQVLVNIVKRAARKIMGLAPMLSAM
jgi:hypothetical protein